MSETPAYDGESREQRVDELGAWRVALADARRPDPVLVQLPLGDVKNVAGGGRDFGLGQRMGRTIGMNCLAVAPNDAPIVSPDDQRATLGGPDAEDDVEATHLAADGVRRMTHTYPEEFAPDARPARVLVCQ